MSDRTNHPTGDAASAFPQRVALIDDNPGDRALVARELVAVAPDVRCIEIADRDGLERLLAARDVDFVVTDYQLRWTDGLAVLDAVHRALPGVPVIMFTGTGSEEIAVEGMKRGLADYVLKAPGRYRRVVRAIESTWARFRSERAAEALAERLAGLLDALEVGVVRTTLDGRVLEANAAMRHLLGTAHADELLGLDLGGMLRERVQATLRRADGFERAVLITERFVADPLHGTVVDAIVEDVTERRRLEHDLRQAIKMEAVGRLAGGVAHDFNNLLTAQIGGLHHLLRHTDVGDARRSEIEFLLDLSHRAAELTAQLLAFSRKQTSRPRRVDLNEIVSRALQLLGRILGEDIVVRTALADDLPSVMGDAAQLEQVVVNLAANARDAMPHGGTLAIETALITLERPEPEVHEGVMPGTYVVLTVGDTGIGMDPITASRMFEPFFTTKPVGKGTGLGLASVYGTVKQAGGEIVAHSREGEGTTVRIYLPPADGEAEPPAGSSAGEVAARAVRGVVLLVEDQEMVRRVLARSLEEAGYTVMEAENGSQALERALDLPRLDALVTDVVMPGISGVELGHRLAAERPGLPVICMSGFPRNGMLVDRRADAFVFLQKPFQGDVLVDVVDQQLALRRAASGA